MRALFYQSTQTGVPHDADLNQLLSAICMMRIYNKGVL